jgi:hypothetical protein
MSSDPDQSGTRDLQLLISSIIVQKLDGVNTHEERILEALHSCPKLCTHLGLQGLSCLAACSNRL